MDLQKQDRRQFMKNSSAVVGGVVLSTLPIGASAFVEGDDVIKVGLIGCGGRGTGAAVQALSTKQNVKLVAMADAFRDRLDKSYQGIMGELENNEVDTGRLSVPEDQKFVGFDSERACAPLREFFVCSLPIAPPRSSGESVKHRCAIGGVFPLHYYLSAGDGLS